MTRREKLVVLLWSLHDFTPGPKSALRTVSGLAAGERVPCPDCGLSDHVGYRVDSFKRRTPCVTCGGKPEPSGRHGQWLVRDAGSGVVQVDRMDSLRAPVRTVDQAAPPTKPSRTVRCDGCAGEGAGGAHLDESGREYRDPCRHCGGSGRRTVAVFDLSLEREVSDSDTRLEDAIEKRAAAGSYGELDRALAELKIAWPSLHRAVVDALVLGDPEAAKLTLVEKAGVPFLLARMPEPIRVSGGVVKAWRASRDRRALAVGRGAGRQALAKRDTEIRSLVKQHKPTQWVAQEYGLSVSTVNRIVAGKPEEEAA